MSDSWTCRHTSLANPRHDGSTDLPRLLRRLADLIEEVGVSPMEILDLTIVSEITEDGPWWSGSLYWSPDTDDVEDEADPPAAAVEKRTG